jgi:hypothetical protein
MKKSAFSLLSILAAGMILLLAPVQSHAQQPSFEGSVNYTIRLSGKMADEMLSNNPPTKMDLHIKDDNFIINLMGGRIPRTFLFIGDSNETYIVDAGNRRAYKRTYFEDTAAVSPKAVPTGLTATVKGYTCQEYKVTYTDRKEIVLFYVTDEFRVDPALFANKKDAKADFLVEGLEGRIPLRKVIKTPEVVTEIDLASIKAVTHDISNFRIPEGFVLRKRDPRY